MVLIEDQMVVPYPLPSVPAITYRAGSDPLGGQGLSYKPA